MPRVDRSRIRELHNFEAIPGVVEPGTEKEVPCYICTHRPMERKRSLFILAPVPLREHLGLENNSLVRIQVPGEVIA